MENSEQELNKKWDFKKIIEEVAKTSHYNPSPETRERLTALEVSQKLLMEENSKEHQAIIQSNEKSQLAIMESLSNFHVSNKEAMDAMNDKLDKALESKAGVWVEKVIIWTTIAIATGILGYFGTLIIKVIELK